MEIGHDSEMGRENFDSLGGKHLHSHKSPRIDCFLETGYVILAFWNLYRQNWYLFYRGLDNLFNYSNNSKNNRKGN